MPLLADWDEPECRGDDFRAHHGLDLRLPVIFGEVGVADPLKHIGVVHRVGPDRDELAAQLERERLQDVHLLVPPTLFRSVGAHVGVRSDRDDPNRCPDLPVLGPHDNADLSVGCCRTEER